MKIPKTEREMAFEELEFQLKKFGNTLLATWLGKFLIWCVEGLNRLLTQHAPDAGDSAASTSISNASEESASENDSNPPQRG